MKPHRSAHGFTIVELLVVASIMAALFGLILAGGRSNAGSEVRRTARQIGAVLLSAQSRAIGSRQGAAVLFESDGNPQAADPKNNRAVRVRDADMAPAITAEVISPFQVRPLDPSVASQAPPFSPELTVVHIPTPKNDPPPIKPENASIHDLDGGFRIRFMTAGTPASAWYGFQNSAQGPLVLLRIADGQTAENSVWPASRSEPPSPPKYAVEISRYPGIGTPVIDFPPRVAIDLRYSGHGDDPAPTSVWGQLASKGVVGVSFDTVGRVELLLQNVTGHGGSRAVQPLAPTQAIYLFVVPRKELEAELNKEAGASSTLASDLATWIAVEPQLGRVTVAANQSQTIATGATPTVDQLRAARKLARAGITAGK